jgi:uncharacterized protein YbbC (DUF1343 family)
MSLSVKTGIDFIEKKWPKHLRSAKIGALVHPASVNRRFIHSSSLLLKSNKFTVTAFFGPQHGIRGETQDNMIEWEGFFDPKTGIPVHSLYGKTRKPTPEMLSPLDAVAIDLQDTGSRYYTFIWTMALVMEACHELSKAVVILDRPNPIGGRKTEGPVLNGKYRSFVGLYELPIRHGMTVGEIGFYLKDRFFPKLNLSVISMQNWKRDMWFDHTGLPWVMPSPNMPTMESATVYPGMCLLEGTNLSEGRGTTRPFEIFGAPFIDPEKVVRKLHEYRLPGVLFRQLYFLPTFQKHADQVCGGAQIHVMNRETFRPFKTASAVLKAIYELYPGEFRWKEPPYEYEASLLPIDILAGTERFRKDIEQGTALDDMEEWWKSELNDFKKNIRKKYLIY